MPHPPHALASAPASAPLPAYPPRPAGGVFLEAPPLLVGVGGMLHRAWANLLAHWGIAQLSPPVRELDLTRPDTIRASIPDGTRLVINCAAYTDVDGAEKDEAIATAVNGTGVGHLAAVCRDLGALLVHYSTDYVFNGRGTEPYRVDAPLEPLNAYGRSKAVGERLLAESGCRYLLVRTSWLYAPWGKNFVRTIVRFVKQKHPLRIVNDQCGRPTSAELLAANTARLIQAGAVGTFHLTDGGQCTWFDFAREIARHFNPDAQVDWCTSDELARPAPRPAYSVLDLTPAEQVIGPIPPWENALADVLRRLE